MDTDFTTTQQRYADFLDNTPAFLLETLKGVSEGDIEEVADNIRSKKRVIFTGTGSSLPAAAHGADLLIQAGFAAQFLATGAMLGLRSLSRDDVVILCSQGLNRGDAILIADKVLKTDATLIILTANRETELRSSKALLYFFEPGEEKLFCRPTGVVTNYALVRKLLSDLIDWTFPGDQSFVDAWMAGARNVANLPADCSRYVILGSSDSMGVAWNVALALREGSGLLTQLFDVETYAHGNYTADLYARENNDTKFGYVFVQTADANESGHSVRRFMPFAVQSDVPTVTLATPYVDSTLAGAYLLATTARMVYELNEVSKYNMNRPPGKEENRYYHKLESYDL